MKYMLVYWFVGTVVGVILSVATTMLFRAITGHPMDAPFAFLVGLFWGTICSVVGLIKGINRDYDE